MKSFIDFAKLADADYQAKLAEVDAIKVQQGEKATLLANTEASLEEKRKALDVRERELNAVNEEVSRKLHLVRSDEESREAFRKGAAALEQSAKNEKKAKEYLDEANQKLSELAKRELALSEEKKVYRDKIRMEVMERVAFGK